MKRFETGLEHRLKRAMRHMIDQHRHLGPIRAELARALERGRRPGALAAYRNLVEAIEAHFRLEDEVFFPALHGLHPDFRAELEALDRDHRELSGALRGLGGRLEAGLLADRVSELAAFESDLAQHERREENLVERIVAAGTRLEPDA